MYQYPKFLQTKEFQQVSTFDSLPTKELDQFETVAGRFAAIKSVSKWTYQDEADGNPPFKNPPYHLQARVR